MDKGYKLTGNTAGWRHWTSPILNKEFDAGHQNAKGGHSCCYEQLQSHQAIDLAQEG